MGTPCSWDMKPRIEKTTNPAAKLVALFRKQRAMLSLWEGECRQNGKEREGRNSSRKERSEDDKGEKRREKRKSKWEEKERDQDWVSEGKERRGREKREEERNLFWGIDPQCQFDTTCNSLIIKEEATLLRP